MPEYSKPAIYRCNLGLLILRLKALGIRNIWDFAYLNQPDEEGLVRALEVLYSLGAIDDEADLTPGKNSIVIYRYRYPTCRASSRPETRHSYY